MDALVLTDLATDYLEGAHPAEQALLAAFGKWRQADADHLARVPRP